MHININGFIAYRFDVLRKLEKRLKKHKVLLLAKTQQKIMRDIQEAIENSDYAMTTSIHKKFLDEIQEWLEQLGYKVSVLDTISSSSHTCVYVSWREEE